MTLSLVKPSRKFLPSYLEALREGHFINMQLGFGDIPAEEIERDPESYLAKLNDRRPFDVELEGQTYKVIDHELLWITDGARFFGTLALRYNGDDEVINTYAGHVGHAIRPALLNQGYGTRAIEAVFDEVTARMSAHGLSHIYITCAPDNYASVRLVEHFGGKIAGEKPDVFGKGPSRRYELQLTP